jgi:hypothetical protein
MDLKDAYFHIPIRECHRKLLRFAFQGKIYQFRVLPFGATAAPRIFTQVLVEVMALIRKKGVFIFPFLDDLLARNQSRPALLSQGGLILNLLASAGFLLNLKKSHLEPSQELVYIGARFRTDLGKAFLPLDLMEALITIVNTFTVGRYRTARQFLQLLGLMASTLDVVQWARLFMRPVQIYLMAFWSPTKFSLEHKFLVRSTLLQNLQWWRSRRNLHQGVLLNNPPIQCTVTTNASLVGLLGGGHMGELVVQGIWSQEEALLHINVLEMRAVFLSLKAFVSALRNKVVLVLTNNTTVMSYINKKGGGDKGSQVVHPDISDAHLVQRSRDNSLCKTHSRDRKCLSRQTIQSVNKPNQLGAPSKDGKPGVPSVGSPLDGSICIRGESEACLLLFKVPRDRGLPSRFSGNQLGKSVGVCLSPHSTFFLGSFRRSKKMGQQ